MPHANDDVVYEVAYAEAVRALSEQHGVIESFRARAGLLLSSAAVTTSFLAGQVFRDGCTGIFAWLALLSSPAPSSPPRSFCGLPRSQPPPKLKL